MSRRSSRRINDVEPTTPEEPPETTTAPARDAVPRLALRLDDIPLATGVSRRVLERERAAGRFPAPDRVVGRMPLWRVETINRWLGGE